MTEETVKVFIYDISKGLARNLSMAFLGKQIDGVWHTGIVVFGEEYYFGGGGIESCPPMGTILGSPDSVHELGKTQIPKELFIEYLQELSVTSFRPECYHLLNHNCNTFSSEVAQFLTGKDIPAHITNLPAEVLSTPFGQMLKPFVDSMSVSPEGGHPLFSPQPSATSTGTQRSDPEKPVSTKSDKHSVPNPKPSESFQRKPVTFTTTISDIVSADQRGELMKDFGDEGPILSEVIDYLSQAECNWSLGPTHIQTLGVILLNSNHSDKSRHLAGGLFKLATLKPDIISVLKHDPKVTISKLLLSAPSLPHPLFQDVTKMVVNCGSSKPGHQLLTSNSPIRLEDESVSNLKLTVGICVHCLLNKDPECWSLGASAITNLLIYGVDEDTGVELSSAILQCLTKELSQNTASLLLWNILKLMENNAEVQALCRVMDIDWERYSSLSVQCRDLATASKKILTT